MVIIPKASLYDKGWALKRMSIADGFGDLGFIYDWAAIQIGNCLGYFDGFKVGAGGQLQLFGGVI